MVPTSRLWLLLAAAAAPHAAAFAWPGFFWIGIAADLLIAGLVLLDAAVSPRPRDFGLSLHADPVASLGSPYTVRLEVANAGGASGASIARLPWPETWTAERPWTAFSLDGHGTQDLSFTATPTRRGRFDLSAAWIRYPSRLGLFFRDASWPLGASVKVYPAVSSLKKYQLLVRRLRLREMGLRAQRIRGQGLEFARLREYQRDDDPRLIDWKASARRDRLISREHQVERCQNIVLMIDTGRMLTEEVDGLVKIEYVLHAALLLTRIAADHDDRVGAIVFSDKIERTVRPRKGRAAVGALAEALFDVQPKLCESDYDAAFRHLQATNRKRALVVLFTNIVDQETSTLVTGYLAAAASRHVPLCVAVDDLETRQLAARQSTTEMEAFEKGAACRLLSQRSRTLLELQRRGVHVIDAPAGHIPIALANRYLDLKARQVL